MPTLDAIRQMARRLRPDRGRDPGPLTRSAKLGFRLVRVVLGLFLLATAGLKAHSLTLGSSPSDSLLFSPRLQIATIEVEVVLGLWLLSGWSARAACVAALGFFAILAAVSFHLALTGQRSCGCFGQVTVSPWLTFVIDVTAMAALALVLRQTARAGDAPPAAWLRQLLKTGAVATALLAVICGVFLLAADDPLKTLAWLRGDSITVEPAATDVGGGPVGEERMFRVQLTNRTDKPVRVVGGTSSCSCLATESLPFTLSGGETRSIDVWVKLRGSPGRFQHRFVLFTDDERQPHVYANFVGRVVSPSAE